jgi:hypothetical protein
VHGSKDNKKKRFLPVLQLCGRFSFRQEFSVEKNADLIEKWSICFELNRKFMIAI